MADIAPPSYEADTITLPSYDGSSHAPRQFEYHIPTHGSDAWWTKLTLNGDARLSASETHGQAPRPTILQGSPVAGIVQLALHGDHTESIHAIHVNVRGEVLGGTPEGITIPIVFLEVKKTLWSSEEGDPNAPGSGSASGSGLHLKGDYSWPFSIELPAEIHKDGKILQLPHSFGTGVGYISIQYVLELHIVRPKLHFGRDERLAVVFNYFALTKPAAPSPLRALAYKDNTPLPGPDVDPEGWHTKTFSISGMLFESREVDIQIEFSLAKPLSYTRSTTIPCALKISSSDTEAVDLLTNPTAPMVYLECTTQQNPDSYRTTMEPCARAVFWTGNKQRRGELMGEIHVNPTLHPTANFTPYGFRVQYSIVLFPFQTAGFKQNGDLEPLKGSRQIVEICTGYAPGPRPKAHTGAGTGEGGGRNAAIDSYYRMRAMATLHTAGEYEKDA
ncbi:hypothetical protein C8F01DRAFT_1339856 [Mycena amicta]|nr:hypothetical protein C8F01DRAFT_1339856 [Mycena amicta]